jgi:hypothetical protein
MVALGHCSGERMSDTVWLTYGELGERLHTSAEGARRRALRAHWPRQPGNDKRTRVGVPADVLADLSNLRGDCSGPACPSADAPLPALARLEGELAGLWEALAEARLRASAADALASEERARADKAIAAFESLAQRLEARAAARRPWWRRLVC